MSVSENGKGFLHEIKYVLPKKGFVSKMSDITQALNRKAAITFHEIKKFKVEDNINVNHNPVSIVRI